MSLSTKSTDEHRTLDACSTADTASKHVPDLASVYVGTVLLQQHSLLRRLRLIWRKVVLRGCCGRSSSKSAARIPAAHHLLHRGSPPWAGVSTRATASRRLRAAHVCRRYDASGEGR